MKNFIYNNLIKKPNNFLKKHQNRIKEQNQEINFNILVYFFISFIILRIFVYASLYNIIPDLYLTIKGIRIHHLHYGIFLVAAIAYLALINKKAENKIKLSKFYGISIALVFDEFGMWLRLEDNYWTRHSYDAFLLITTIFLNTVYLGNFWKKILKKTKNYYIDSKKLNLK